MKTLLAFLLYCGVFLASIRAAEITDTVPVVSGNAKFAMDLYAKLKNEQGEPVLLAVQHFDRVGDDVRRGAW
jgi:hypothetical protein